MEVDESDPDQDGLMNYWEDYFGTDPYNADSDGDGVSDADEVAVLGTDPLKEDTFLLGCTDGEADFDQDGLSNAEELSRGTSPFLADTDGDSLSDFDELRTYKTDPLLSDTDGDGASDGWEMENDYDPKVKEELFEVQKSSDDQSAMVYYEGLDGKQAEETKISLVEDNQNLYSVPGAKSEMYQLGAVESGTVSIACPKERSISNLEIYAYDLEQQEMIPLETKLEGGYLVADTLDNQDAAYLVVDKTEFEDLFTVNEVNCTKADTNQDGISDADTHLMCEGKLLTGTGNLVFGEATYEEVQANADYDGDGLINGEEIEFAKDGERGCSYVILKSSPILVDTDQDGISDKEDTAPLERGLKDGIMGAVQIYARHNDDESFLSGHGFLVFTSYVDGETITVNNLNCAYVYNEEQATYVLRTEPDDSYSLSRGDYVSIGNYRSAGLDSLYHLMNGNVEAAWEDIGLNEYLDYNNITLSNLMAFLLSENSSTVIMNAIAGFASESIRFNEEIYDTYAYEGFTQYPNAVLTKEVTQEQLDTILNYISGHNYYEPFANNCSSVAAGAWNAGFCDTLSAKESSGIYSIFDSPMVLKSHILEREGSKEDVKTFGVAID